MAPNGLRRNGMFNFKNRSLALIALLFISSLTMSNDIFAQGQFREKLKERIQNRRNGKNIPAEDRSALSSITVDGRKRTYILHLPASYSKGQFLPVVFVLHGGFGNAKNAQKMSGMNLVADKEGFIAVYPNGSGNTPNKMLTWNDGFLNSYARKKNIDDVKFIRLLIEKLKKDYNVDEKKLYFTGISNGGIMCYRLACEAPEYVSAIAPVSSSMVGYLDDCKHAQSVPVIIFHGKDDKNIPYMGGTGEKGFAKYDYPSVQQAVDFWITRNGLSRIPIDEGRIGSATYKCYGSKSQKQVILWTLEDGGHTWPGGNRDLPESVTGKVNTDISASYEMWKFFKDHHKE
jgi:polyhydroxybutyrate depolymerase